MKTPRARTPLEHVQRLIKKLSPEERQSLISFLASLPSSGLHSYDPREELALLKKHGQRIGSQTPESGLFNIVFVRNLVGVEIFDTSILHAAFKPDAFASEFPKTGNQIPSLAEKFKAKYNEEMTEALRAERAAAGIKETDVELENEIIRRCYAAAEYWMLEKAKRIAERISLHFPGMIGDMMATAIRGESFYDLHAAFKELSPDREPPSLREFKKIVQDAAWREMKPHLPSTKHVRTHKDWQGDEARKRYANRVNDRRSLASRIKEMYEECDYAPGWIEDLKHDTTFERLSVDVPSPIIDWAITRTASDDVSERERQPLSIALEMARRELELQEQDIETLHKYYGEGNKLVKQERSQRPPSSI